MFLVKDPSVVNITNKKDVAQSLEDLSKVDGVNVDSMNVTTYDDKDNEELNVTIEAFRLCITIFQFFTNCN